MEERKYYVEMNGTVVAENMELRDATLLIKALAEEYFMNLEYGDRIILGLMAKDKEEGGKCNG